MNIIKDARTAYTMHDRLECCLSAVREANASWKDGGLTEGVP